MAEWLLLGLPMGIGATFTMDQLAKVGRHMGIIAGIEGRWVGRWFLSMRQGRLRHDDIRSSPEHPGEFMAARVFHYGIGIVLAMIYLTSTHWLGFSPKHILTALTYGFATNVFPWFLMFPAMGFGLIGLKGPPERKLFISSLLNHFFYGFGLWWTTLLFFQVFNPTDL